MNTVYLTPASIAYLAQVILAIGITGYFASLSYAKVWRRRHRDPQLLWLTTFFAALSGFLLAFWLSVSLAPGWNFYGLCPVTVFTAWAAVALIQFAYHFPQLAPQDKVEARIALGWTLLYALYESGFALYRFAQLFEGRLVFRPDWADYPLAVAGLWALMVLLRQVVRASEESTPRPWWQKLWRPRGKDARTARVFVAIFLIMLFLAVSEVLFTQLIVAESIRNTLLSVGMTIALFVFAIAYLNHFPETTSFLVKVIGVSLLISLVSFGVLGWLIGPLYLDRYTHMGVFADQQTLHFAPNAAGGYTVSRPDCHYESKLGTRLDLADGDSVQMTLPFPFTFYGKPWHQIYVSDDGMIGFAHPVGTLEGRYHYGPQPAIFVLYTDLVPAVEDQEAGHVYVKAEADRLILTWDRLPERLVRGEVYTLQLTLSADGSFDITYNGIPAFDVATLYQAGHTSYSQWLVGAVPGNPKISPDRIDMAASPPFQAGPDGVVEDPYLALRQHLHPLLLPLAYLLIGNSVLILVGGTIFFSMSLIAPLNGLLKGIRRVNHGDLTGAISIQNHDEIGFITESFNTMTTRLNGLVTELETRVAERTRALRESERIQAALISNLPGMVYRCKNDPLWTMEFVSEGCLALTGCPPAALLHNAELAYATLIHPDDREAVWSQVQADVQAHRPFQVTYRIIAKNGEEKWVWEQGQGIFDNQGRPLELEGLMTDITAQRCTEQELLTRERELRMITDNIPLYIGHVDAGLHYQFVNQRYVEAFGLENKEIIGKHVKEVLGEAFYERARPHIQTALAGQEISFESTLDIPRLGRRWLNINYVPEVAIPGNKGGLYILVVDITERKQAEEAIRRSEEHFRLLFETNPFPILITRAIDGSFVQANQAALDYIGVTRADLTTTRAPDYYTLPIDRQTLIAEVHAHGSIVNRMIELKTRQGQPKFALVNILPLAFNDESCLLVGMADITEREQIEKELRSLNDRFELYLKYIPVPMYVKDADTRAIILSRQFEQMLRKPLHELLGKTNIELWPPDLAAAMTLDDGRILRGDQAETVEETFEGRHYYSVKFPIKEPGHPPLLGGYTVDITELKQVQAALQESEARMRQITASMRQAVWLRDTRTLEVLYVNPAYEQIWGRTCESLIVDPTSFTQAIHPADRGRIMEAIQKQYQGVFFNQEYRISRPDGAIRWVWGRTFPIKNDAGEVYRILAVVEDITERRLMEEALRQAKDAAEAANRAKSTFLANMSHELRTPLSAVLGFSELMTHDPNLTQTQRENLDIIGRSGEYLLALINDVLALSKIEAGRAELQPETFDLHEMLLALGEMFSLRARQKGLSVVFDFAPNTPRYIRADAGKLRQVLTNLLGNAVKFTDRGGVTLRVSVCAPESAPGKDEHAS